jgi:GLPGLI family protein
MKVFKFILCLFGLIVQIEIQGQTTCGRIVYERKVNLQKRFKHNDSEYVQKLLEENKYKVEQFELLFNDSLSLFRVLNENLMDPLAWMTKRNLTLQNLNDSTKMVLCNVFGQDNYVSCKSRLRTWKITTEERIIAGYKCRIALWETNEGERIYAWYSIDVLAQVGPDGFFGLPGAILGLASEDGGIVYFATSFEPIVPTIETFEVKQKKKSSYSEEEFKVEMLEKHTDDEVDRIYWINYFNWF